MTTHPLRPQFSLRAALAAMTLAAVFLAWRFQGSREAQAVAAIKAAGGKVYFSYQEPSLSFTDIGSGYLPDWFTCFPQVDVQVNGATSLPMPTLRELVTGADDDDTVHTVEISPSAITPEVAAQLKSLGHLQRIVLNMPVAVVSRDSPDLKRLEALRAEFPDRIVPAFDGPF